MNMEITQQVDFGAIHTKRVDHDEEQEFLMGGLLNVNREAWHQAVATIPEILMQN